MNMPEILTGSLQTINDLLTAGIAITAFSLLLYALSFNLRDRVARSLAIILLCVVVVYVGEALSTVSKTATLLAFWFRFQWLGIIFLPSAYLHFSDAILETTGKPSRGRRRWAVRCSYLISILFVIALLFSQLVGPLVQYDQFTTHLERTRLTIVFTGLYLIAMGVSWWNFWRAYQRTVTSASRRRMRYLIAGALAPAVGTFPYLLFGFQIAAQYPILFWITVITSNLLVSILLVLMAYSVAFFGVAWPDRVVKRRLFKWLLRGPVTASTVLAITTFVNRLGARFEINVSTLLPVLMVFSILVLEHIITLTAPTWEQFIFPVRDRNEMELLQSLEDRLLTSEDMHQFLEAILAAVCDQLQLSQGFIAGLSTRGIDLLVTIGNLKKLDLENLSADLLEQTAQNGRHNDLFSSGDFWLVPLFEDAETRNQILGLLGIQHEIGKTLNDEQAAALSILVERASLALKDLHLQQQAFSSLQDLAPQMDMIQYLRAASRYDGSDILSTPYLDLASNKIPKWVKEALSHYWGGPKLTQSPLMDLQVVQQALPDHDENPTNALRAILRSAVEQVRPEGDRKFTAEWILYNILDMKFLEGRKVREVAMRLAMSEADLYRKQRVAIERVARAIIEMETQARQEDTVESTGEIKNEAGTF